MPEMAKPLSGIQFYFLDSGMRRNDEVTE